MSLISSAIFTRGCESRLVKATSVRSAALVLDAPAWDAPAWIGDGPDYFQAMADCVAQFLHGAKQVHGLKTRCADTNAASADRPFCCATSP